MDLLKETTEIMDRSNLFIEDIEYINYGDDWDSKITMGSYDWEWFLEYCKDYTNYDNGYGTPKIGNIEIVFNNGTWLDRGEYDGSEWWDVLSTPERQEDKEKEFVEDNSLIN